MPGELAAPFAVAVDHVSQLTVNGVPDASTQASTLGIRSLCHEATTFEDRVERLARLQRVIMSPGRAGSTSYAAMSAYRAIPICGGAPHFAADRWATAMPFTRFFHNVGLGSTLC